MASASTLSYPFERAVTAVMLPSSETETGVSDVVLICEKPDVTRVPDPFEGTRAKKSLLSVSFVISDGIYFRAFNL